MAELHGFPGAAVLPAARAPFGLLGSTLAAVARSLAGRAVAERDRWALWAPVGLAAGIVAYFSLHREPPPLVGGLAAAVALAILLLARVLAPPWRQCVRLAAAAAGLVALGFAAAQLQTALATAAPLPHPVGPLGVAGVIRAIEPLPDGARILIDGVRAEDGRTPLPQRVRLKLRADGQPPMAPGDRIRVAAVLSPPPAPVIPGGYDFQREAFFSGLGAVGFAVGHARVSPPAEAAGSSVVATTFARLRHAIAEEVRRTLPSPTSAVVIALLVGQQRAIPEPAISAIRDAGLAHLLAISGLHIGLVAALVMVALRSALALVPFLALRYPIKKWAAAAAILAAGFYMLLAGAPVPSQRAFLMVLLVLSAVLLDRRTTPMRLVAIAAVAVCLTQPVRVLGPSFQMSFFAVIGLIAAYEWTLAQPGLRTARAERWRPLVYLAGVLASSLIATLATAPFVIFHFNRLAVFGLAANLVAVPLTSLWIMPWAIIALLLMPFGLAPLALLPMGWGVDAVLAVAEGVAGWPGAVAQLPPMPPWALAAAAFGLLWLCLWRGRWRTWGLAPLAIAAAGTLASTPPDLLIDGRGKLIAVRAADGGLLLSSARASAMAREAWLRAGERAETIALFPAAGSSADGRLSCDHAGCLWRHGGRLIALPRLGEALLEDCRRADAVVSPLPVRRRCPVPGPVIDRFDLWREGAHALWLRPEGIVVRSVDGVRGARPWVPQRRAAGRGAEALTPATGADEADEG